MKTLKHEGMMNYSALSRMLFKAVLVFALLLCAAEALFAVNDNLLGMIGEAGFLSALVSKVVLPGAAYFIIFGVMAAVGGGFIRKQEAYPQAITVVTAVSLMCFAFVNLHYSNAAVYGVFIIPTLTALAYLDKRVLAYGLGVSLAEYILFGGLSIYVYGRQTGTQEIYELAIPLVMMIGVYALARLVVRAADGVAEGMRQKNERMRHDPATKFLNRSAFFQTLDEFIAANREKEEDFSLMMLSIDNYRSIETNYGKEAVDDVIRELVRSVNDCVEPADMVFRYGEEEFMIITARSGQETKALSQRIREEFAGLLAEIPIDRTVAVSAGICEYRKDVFGNNREFVSAADRALHSARQVRDKNTSVVWHPENGEKRNLAY